MIIGAGFGGLTAALALRRKGIDDLVIIDRADGVGGTWRQNVYPGATCDIQSHLHSFSFAPNRAWSRTYAYQPEISRRFRLVTGSTARIQLGQSFNKCVAVASRRVR